MATARELLDLKERLTKEQARRQRLQGELDALEAQMVKEFGTKDPEKLKERASKLAQEASRLSDKVDTGVEAIEKELK